MGVLPEVTKVGPTHMPVAHLSSLLLSPPAHLQHLLNEHTYILSGIHARSLDLNKCDFMCDSCAMQM